MAIVLRTTQDVAVNGVKILVYGMAGAGKTSLIPTLPNPVILSAEGGLLSIAGSNIPYIEVSDYETLMDAYTFLTESTEGQQFDSIALDSISEIAEVVLNAEKKKSKDPRQAYGAMIETMQDLIRAFRDIKGRHIYFTAKCEKEKDEAGRLLYSPSMPGTKLGPQLPFFFDEVFAMRVEPGEDGKPIRAIQCSPDGLWQAKDRSGKLDAWEPPHLGEIIAKIAGGKAVGAAGAGGEA